MKVQVKDKPKIRVITRLGGLIKIFFLVKGKCPDSFNVCPHQSKNKKHKGLTLVKPKRKPFVIPDNFRNNIAA